MKTKILSAFVALVASIVSAQSTTYWAAAYTEACHTFATDAGVSAYSGYCCTEQNAYDFFGVKTVNGSFDTAAVSAVTEALRTDFDGNLTKLAALDASAKLASVDYINGQYGLESTASGSALANTQYLALLFYANGDERAVRVMACDSEALAKGTAFFDDNPRMSDGANTPWTVAAVPEPTSGLLLLFGLAGLALRRKRA